MLHIICALKHEARPIIDHYGLAHDGSARTCTSYRNEDISVTITGAGRQAAGAGTRFAADHFHAGKTDAWLNIGIAGHRSLPVGTVVMANRVMDTEDGTVWCPDVRIQGNLAACTLMSVSKPLYDYSPGSMFDMEAAGFYRAAMKHGAQERIHCLKIISDNETQRFQTISKRAILELISSNLTVISEFIARLRAY
jgi:nucleoside phosphorylase